PASHGGLEQMQSITTRLLKAVTSDRVPAVGFVNEAKLNAPGEEAARTVLLKMWLDAGLELGNHTFSHINIDRVSLAAYKEDVIRGEPVTRKLLREKGLTLRFFRHPMLHTGPTLEYKKALDAFLAERGYVVAPVTIDNNDFIFALAYYDAKRQGDEETMKRLGEAYIPYMEMIFDFFEKLSVETLGYEVKQTLLLHANEINADYFSELVQMMKGRGYAFITLGEALKDPAYRLPDPVNKLGVSWIHRWRQAKGLKTKAEPKEPAWVTSLFNEALRKQSR
ncbi:MAG: polysaccharide deacetylase family protein, partial [Blastocatellia bacterium]